MILNSDKCRSKYLKEYQYSTSERDDLRQVFEKVTELNLLGFFDQWVYRDYLMRWIDNPPKIEFVRK